MKKLYLIIYIMIFAVSPGALAQDADERIHSCISQQDWFTLETEYPVLRDSLSNPVLKWFSQAMLGICFNRPHEAMMAIDTLLMSYQSEIGSFNVVSMVYFKSSLLEQQGRYAEAADLLGDFLSQASPVKSKDELTGILRYYGYMKELCSERSPSLKRPKRDVMIPLSIERAGRGSHLFVPVKVRGKEYSFIFDTGAEKSILSKKYADLLGVRIVYDSLTINGVGGQSLGKLGILDRLEIGKIVYKNMVVAVIPDNPEIDSVYTINAVLGCDFMKAVGEVQILPKERKIVFPYLESLVPENGKNMMYDPILPYVKGFSKDERLLFQFDTGNVLSDLNVPFYERHKEWVEHYGVSDIIHSGGLGGMQTVHVYRLRSFPLRIGDVDLEMKDLNVNADTALPTQKMEDGVLGMSFIQLFDKIVINFKDMFLKVVN